MPPARRSATGRAALLLAGAAISMFGYLGGMTLSMPRILYAFGRDGFLPKALAQVDAVHHAPRPAIVVQSIITVILAVTGSFERLAIFANIAALALYFGCAVASWRLRGSDAPTVIPWLACAVIVWLLTGVTLNEWLAFWGCVALASLLYALTRGQQELDSTHPSSDLGPSRLGRPCIRILDANVGRISHPYGSEWTSWLARWSRRGPDRRRDRRAHPCVRAGTRQSAPPALADHHCARFRRPDAGWRHLPLRRRALGCALAAMRFMIVLTMVGGLHVGGALLR